MNAEALASSAPACLLRKLFFGYASLRVTRDTLPPLLLHARISLTVGQTQLQRAFFLP